MSVAPMRYRLRLALFVFILTAGLTGVAVVVGYLTPPNLMVYGTVGNYSLRDLHTTFSIPLPERAAFPALSPDGRVAYSRDDKDIYIWDYRTSIKVTDVNRTQMVQAITWSYDGSWLAISSYLIGLQIWDGQQLRTINPLSHDGGFGRWLVWGPDNQLVMDYGVYIPASEFMPQVNENDLYLWDGDMLINVSQNPQMNEVLAAWSQDGQLAFLLHGESGVYLLIWDGTLTADHTVDPSSFTHLTSQLGIALDSYSAPRWIGNGNMVFQAYDLADSRRKLYRWDGQSLTLMSQAAGQETTRHAWYNETRWARQMGQSDTPLRDLIVQDRATEHLIVEQASLGPMIWSPAGDLFFCRLEDSTWVLMRWDGNRLHEEGKNFNFELYFQNGAMLNCMFSI